MGTTQVCLLLISAASLFTHTATAWQTSLTLDLAWPTLDQSGVITENGVRVGPDSDFPCATIPVSEHQTRIAFPVSGFSPLYNLQNSTTAQSQSPGYYFISNVYIGQVSSDITANKSGWADLTTDVFDGSSTGPQCGSEIDLPSKFAYSPPPFLTLISNNLVGANATLGLRIILLDSEHNNQEEMFQCSYLTLVAPNTPVVADGICNDGYSLFSSSSSTTASPTATVVPSSTGPANTQAPTITPSSPPSPTTVPSILPASPQNETKHNTTKIVAIAVPIGIAGLLIVLGTFIFIRRRTTRKPKPTIALDFFVRGHPNEHKSPETHTTEVMEMKNTKKGKGSLDGDGTSFHSVDPLPLYKQTDV